MVRKNSGKDERKFYAMKVQNKSRLAGNYLNIVYAIGERHILEQVRDCPFTATLKYSFQDDKGLYLVQGEAMQLLI